MNAILYQNAGDPRQLNKAITQLAEVNIEVTNECDIMSPSFKLLYNDRYINGNYILIPSWGRYYFISNKRILNGEEILIDCNIDVLMSFKNAILNSQCIASRSASRVDEYIPDSVVSDKGTVTYHTRRSGTNPFTGSSYVLTVAGK